MKSNIIKEFNLPNYVKGKSFSEAAKAIEKKFEGRENNEAMRTKEELLARVAKAQEYTKMQDSLKANSQEVPDMMNGQIPEGVDPAYLEQQPQQAQNQMMIGGVISPESANIPTNAAADANGAQQGASAAGVVGMAGTALELGQTAFGDSAMDTTGLSGRQQAGSVGGAAASGALKGAAAGAALGPWGAAVGGVLGGAAGIVGGSKAKKDALEGNLNAGLIENNKFTNDFASGGMVDPTEKDKELTDKDVKSINKSTGIDFNSADANSLFAKIPGSNVAPPVPINYGKYADVNYFKTGATDGDSIRIANTENNPHNPSTMKPVMNELRKLNPGRDIQLDYNQFADGGFGMNSIIKGTESPQLTPDDFIIGANGVERAKQSNGLAIGHSGVEVSKNSLQMNSQGVSETGRSNFDKSYNTDLKVSKDSALSKAGSWVGDNYGNILRGAPIAANALALKNLKKSNDISLDRMDQRYKENPVDERALTNQVTNQTAGTNKALANASNGSMGALRSNILGAGLNSTNALSNAYLQAKQMNNADNTRGQQFNASVDAQNMRQGTIEQQMNDQNKGAYNSAKSALSSQLATDIGSFGKEKVNMKQVAEMFGYKWDGTYMVDKNGKKFTPEQIAKLNNKG